MIKPFDPHHWSKVMWLGTLCFKKTCLTNSPASMTVSIDLTVGMNIACLVSWSTTTRMSVCITNFIWPYLHQFFDDSHSLNGYKKPLKNLLIDASHVSRQSIMAEILGRSTGNYHGTVY